MKTLERVSIIGVAAILVAGIGMSGAMAATNFYGGIEKNGSWARAAHVDVAGTTGYDRVYNKDTADDSQFTSTNWKYGSSTGTSLVNKRGFGVTVYKTATYHPSKVTAIEACRSRTALPMICSGYQSVSH